VGVQDRIRISLGMGWDETVNRQLRTRRSGNKGGIRRLLCCVMKQKKHEGKDDDFIRTKSEEVSFSIPDCKVVLVGLLRAGLNWVR